MKLYCSRCWMPSKMCKCRAIIALACFALTGCATMTTGTTQTLAVASDPPGAQCHLSNSFGAWDVITPATITIHRGTKPLAIACTKPGYADTARDVKPNQSKMTTAAAAGGVVGILLSAAVDGSNGASGEYPAKIEVAMEPSK